MSAAVGSRDSRCFHDDTDSFSGVNQSGEVHGPGGSALFQVDREAQFECELVFAMHRMRETFGAPVSTPYEHSSECDAGRG